MEVPMIIVIIITAKAKNGPKHMLNERDNNKYSNK